MAEQHKPPTWKAVLAWASTILGVLVVLGGLLSIEKGGVGAFIGAVIMVVAIILPGGWWMYCEKHDRDALRKPRRGLRITRSCPKRIVPAW